MNQQGGPLLNLAARWRADALVLRKYMAESQAELLERCADEMEAAEASRQLEAVTLEEAVELSGYSYSHLQHLVADGTIENVGKKGAPRIRREDVPRKAGHGSTTRYRSKREIIDEWIREDREGSAH